MERALNVGGGVFVWRAGYKQMDHCELEKNHPFVFSNTHYGPALQYPSTPPSKLRCIPTYISVLAV